LTLVRKEFTNNGESERIGKQLGSGRVNPAVVTYRMMVSRPGSGQQPPEA